MSWQNFGNGWTHLNIVLFNKVLKNVITTRRKWGKELLEKCTSLLELLIEGNISPYHLPLNLLVNSV
jgi:hypothetical protein